MCQNDLGLCLTEEILLVEGFQSGLLFLKDWGNEGISSLPLQFAAEDIQVQVVSW